MQLVACLRMPPLLAGSESLLTVALYRADRRGTISRTVTIGDACNLSRLPIRKRPDVAALLNIGA